ncbi:MAG: hypothetical protein JSW06_03085 [Thermoplasmatales archaeon]|nr:MAG: hypothetical protein JSW06_03085 [Thermoplasmatales archaeon]
MKRSKPVTKYQGFALSVPFIQEIRVHIQDDDRYRSITDYVRQAVREKMDKEKERKELFTKELQLSKEIGVQLKAGASKEDVNKKLLELIEEQQKISLKMREILHQLPLKSKKIKNNGAKF